MNPLDFCIQNILSQHSEQDVVVDCGCGEGRLALSIPNPTRSFDFVSLHPHIEEADMSNLPLIASYADIMVFCLSLMSPELSSILQEAKRVLKHGGILKIAEVRSRIEDEEEERKEAKNKKKNKKAPKHKKTEVNNHPTTHVTNNSNIGYNKWDEKLAMLGFHFIERVSKNEKMGKNKKKNLAYVYMDVICGYCIWMLHVGVVYGCYIDYDLAYVCMDAISLR